VTCSIARRLHAAANDLRAERTTLQFLIGAHLPQVWQALLAIPLGNLLPGLALVFAGLGLLRRDGLGLLLGAGCALVGIIWPLALALALAVVAWSSLDGVVAQAIGP